MLATRLAIRVESSIAVVMRFAGHCQSHKDQSKKACRDIPGRTNGRLAVMTMLARNMITSNSSKKPNVVV